jgi:hypothetical protein
MDGAKQCQMSDLARSDEPKVNQVQMKSKAQMTKFDKKNLLGLSHLAFL